MHTVSWGLVVAALRAMLRWRGGSAGSCTTWRGLGVCWVGVAVSWRVAGCCAPCRGGVGAGRGWALRATLKGRGGLAGSWRVLGWGGGSVAGRRGLGVPCWVGEVGWRWWGGGAGWRWFACTNGLQSPGSCAVLGRRGGLAVAGWRGRMGVARMHEWAAISRVLRRVGVARWVGSGGVSEQDGGGSRAQMAVLRAVLGRRVGGGSMLQAMSGRRVGAGTNGSGSCAQGDGNGLQR
ncbi:hypothetical protein EDB89DRAFT_1902404 [Lactarius sanguifluus]|nr:hypothetical protein EDB89DRAFT_1902404 [Lactarius sanguifluus]